MPLSKFDLIQQDREYRDFPRDMISYSTA